MLKIVYVDLDDTLCDYAGGIEMARKSSAAAYPQSEPGFFKSLVPLPGAIETMKRLLESEEYEPFILTAPSTLNPLCYTEKRLWVETHLGMEFVERLIISPRKDLLKGQYLIDDYDHGKGQESFGGQLLHFGTNSCPDWHAVALHLGL
ncbi:5' nucleotidase, NT5C type [Vibrio mediterranei]|uniref:5' nucleotidase, NT5C type n=1 Tax=Vibrio mediterranei TaxID=689 RepID=UPI0040676D19